MSGGSGNPQPQPTQPTQQPARLMIADAQPQVQSIIPNHNQMVAAQLARGGYGSPQGIIGALNQQQQPNHDWFYRIINQPSNNSNSPPSGGGNGGNGAYQDLPRGG